MNTNVVRNAYVTADTQDIKVTYQQTGREDLVVTVNLAEGKFKVESTKMDQIPDNWTEWELSKFTPQYAPGEFEYFLNLLHHMNEEGYKFKTPEGYEGIIKDGWAHHNFNVE